MKKTVLPAFRGKNRLFAGTGLVALSFAAFATPAFAQDASTPVDCVDEDDDGVCDPISTISSADGSAAAGGGIVVTGSRIRRDEFSTIEPITVISAEEITQAGFNSAADALQSTAVTAGSGQINNYFGGFVTDGGTGANTLGLRNLGPARTLVLLNGRRLAPGGTRGSVVAADLNVLPTSIVERIEILKAGASSVYGSDAVAGVVNIITDSQLRGLKIELQTNVPEVGAGVSYRGSASFGFETERLNVIGSIEYSKREKLAKNDVNFTRCPVGGYLDGEGSEFGSAQGVGFDGSPCFTLDNGGVTINTIGTATRNGISRTTGLPGRFNRFVPAPGGGGNGTAGFLGVDFYSRDTFDPIQEEEPLITEAEILTGFVAASYALDSLGNAEIYGEVLGTRRKSASPLYRQLSLDYPVYLLPGTFTVDQTRLNPLVPAQFQNSIVAFPNATTGDGFLGVRAFIGYGLTDSEQSVDYVRLGGGIRGDFFLPDWRYDAYVGKSYNDGVYSFDTFLTDRIAQSTDVQQLANGTIVCASLAVNPNCVAAPPLNAATVGGNLPQNYRDWIVAEVEGTTQFRETTFAFNIDGPLFAMPGGDVQLALGAEYRKQSINDQPDPESVNGNTYNLTAGTPTVGSDNVKEVFGEVFIPILSDVPFFHRLNMNASARYTDYASYGSDVTYKFAGEWQPIPAIGFRGSYGTSYRAPALAEQFLGATSGFLASNNDPCDNRIIGQGNQIITANCTAIGLPAGTTGMPGFQQTSGITVLRVGGAEAGLAAETSKNWTIGAVLRPPLPESIGTLSLALDYFDIEVSNGVADLPGGTILNRCYSDNNFNPNEGFCRFVARDANNRLTVTSSFVNLATDIVRGYEFNGRFATGALGGRLVLNANVTKYTEQSSKLFEEEFLTDTNGIVTQPDWVGAFDVTYRTGPITLRYGLDWIDGDNNKTYEWQAFDNLTGEVDQGDLQFFKDNYFLETSDYFLHSASIQFNPTEKFEMTAGVRNLFNAELPRVSADIFNLLGNAPLYSGYDYRGRTFFVNTTFDF